MDRINATEEGYSLGWSYVQLNGKIPTEKNWAARDRESATLAKKWAEAGNVGIRTGKNSGGLVVVDIDDGADISDFDFPDTVTVMTGSGGFHLYFYYQKKLKNSASKIGPKIDIRADGGQVVAVGSIHNKTKKPYRYASGLSPKDVEIATLPAWIVKRLSSKKTTTKKKRSKLEGDPDAIAYANAALEFEREAVSVSDEGERNDNLNKSAFSIGTLVGAGLLDKRIAMATLESAADACGLIDADGLSSVRATIRSGIESGQLEPRDIPNRLDEPVARDGGSTEESPPPSDDKDLPRAKVLRERPTIKVPGSHLTKKGYSEVSNDEFAKAVVKALPEDVIYNRGGVLVEILGEPGHRKLEIVTSDRMRIIIDRHMRLVLNARKSKKLCQLYRNATREWANLIIASINDSIGIRPMNLFTNYPVYNTEWKISKPGWHEGTFYDEPPELSGIKPKVDVGWGIIEDLLVDFPFSGDADMENFVSLLLTPMIKPAILGNVPLFLVKSSLPRTGKTKLAEQVLGGIYLGEETPAMQWSSNEDERDKRILAVLKQGDTLLHVDNVSAYMDSPALASLVTSKYYQGRLLGKSQMMRLENSLTIVATANNPRATGEIVKRTVPITLQPETESPELRDDFKHPHLFKYVLNRRPRVWEWMMGMIEHYKNSGFPATKMKMGGFEGWMSAMSGVMHCGNAVKWMSNWQTWVKEADPEGEDLKDFVSLWWTKWEQEPLFAKQLFNFAKEHDLFGMILSRARSDQGQLTMFSQGVLVKYLNAPVDDLIIKRGSNRSYYLQQRKELDDGTDD
jgi:hypothetical protein